jgi:hypothetical protein
MSDDPSPGPQVEPLAANPGRHTDRSRLEQEIRARYADELARADICDSLRVEMRIRAEIAQALAGCDAPVA